MRAMDLGPYDRFLPHLEADVSHALRPDLVRSKVRNDVGKDTGCWLTLRAPTQRDIAIVLQPPLPSPMASEAQRRVVIDLMTKGTFAIVTPSSADVGVSFAQLAQGDAEVVREPIGHRHGVRPGARRDPAATLVCINQP